MITELKKEEFQRISPLLAGEYINLEIKSVAEGYSPGWIFVDDPAAPRTAMVWSRGIEGFYFVGDAENPAFTEHIDRFIDEEIFPRAKALGLEHFEFSGTSRAWDERFERIFKHRNPKKSKQFVYRHRNLNDLSLDHGEPEKVYSLKEISENLLRSDQHNSQLVKETIEDWWESTEDFFKYGAGFAIFHSNTAVCVCSTSFRNDQSMESHIITAENHRKKGLATVAVSAFLNYCKEQEYIPYWDCMEENHGSRALAKKFGYTKEFEYFLYCF